MPDEQGRPEQPFFAEYEQATLPSATWQRGEIRAHPAGGLFVSALFLSFAVGFFIVDTSQGKPSSWIMLAVIVLFLVPILRIVGRGARWDDKGIQFLWFGRSREFIAWSEGLYYRSGGIQTSSGANLVMPQTQSPKQSSATSLAQAVVMHMPVDEPRRRTYQAPPAQEGRIRVGPLVAWAASIASLAFFAALLSHMRAITQTGQWPPDWGYLVTLLLCVCIWVGAMVREGRRAGLSTYRWMPAPLCQFHLWSKRRPETPPWKPDELVAGNLYVYSGYSLGLPKSMAAIPKALLAWAWIATLILVARTPAADVMTILVGGTAFVVLFCFCVYVAMKEQQSMPKVDAEATLEVTSGGVRLWINGEPTGLLSYPRKLATRWSKWTLGGEVELWSDGERQFAVDRRYMTVLVDPPPCVRYAATEGAGWLHPESKAIAAQMLAERDWSKPLPKKGQ